MAKLKPCPFCGGEAELYRMKRDSRKRYGVFTIGVSASTLKNRYYLGWSVEDILTLSVSRRKPRRGNLSA